MYLHVSSGWFVGPLKHIIVFLAHANSLIGPQRKRISLSPPTSAHSIDDDDALYNRVLQTAGVNDVTDHVASIGPTRASASELLVLDRALPGPLSSVRDAMITRLLSTISELDTAENRIRQASIKAQKLWRALDPSVSPISKLPDDLLILIFEHGARLEVVELLAPPGRMDEAPKISSGDSPLESSFLFPLIASHICQNWRALALQRSSLWTVIRPDWKTSQIAAWLSRSKSKGLHIDMRDDRCPVSADRAILLRSVLGRWVSISLSIRSESLIIPGLEMDDLVNNCTNFIFDTRSGTSAPIPIPSLKHLSISATSPVQLYLETSRDTLLPRLETLVLDNTTIDSLDEFFPNVMLATIDISGLFSWNWSGIGAAQRLQSLTLRSRQYAPDEEDEVEASASPWSLPTLKHLCIDTMPMFVCQSFLRLLRAPNLESFHVNLRGKDRRARQAILSFVSVSLRFANHTGMLKHHLRLLRIPP